MTVRLDGQIAVVTGGRGDLGRAFAAAFVERGAAVSVADRVPIGADDRSSGIHHAELDVTDAGAVGAWLDRVESELGTPSIVVPAAAIATAVPLLELSPEQWRAELDADLTAPFLLAQDAARRMIHAGVQGRIAFIGSWAAHAPHPHVAAYSVAKAGLRMLTRVMAAELGPNGILVNELAIGVVDAGVSRTTFATHPELRARSERRAPLRRLVSVDDIVGQVLALVDPAQTSMTGTTITLDAGMSLRTAFGSDAEDDA